MTFNVEPFSKQSFELGEGPHWYNDKLYFVDILDGTAGTLDSNGVYHLLHKEKDNIVSAVFPVEGDDQSIAFSTKLGVYSLNLTTGNKKLIDSLEGDGFRFNDAKCDSKHRLWIGTMGLETSPGVLQPEKGLPNKVKHFIFTKFAFFLKALSTRCLVKGNLKKD